MIITGFILSLAAVVTDQLLGEPKRFHPLVGFGAVASSLERLLNHAQKHNVLTQRLLGAIALLICVGIPVFCVSLITPFFSSLSLYLEYLFILIVLYACIGFKSLIEHAQAIKKPLLSDDKDRLVHARQAVGMIVSRDTGNMDDQAITNAAIESVLENGADALFSVLFWYCLIGIEGAVAYRLVNTLDAMWGYKTVQFKHFGFSAAKLDDLMNYIPARLTALSYALCGNTCAALKCWRCQAHLCESPNGGPVMTAGAGALGITLGGNAQYHGQRKEKPLMGVGAPPSAIDIGRACQLVKKALVLWLTLFLLILLITKV